MHTHTAKYTHPAVIKLKPIEVPKFSGENTEYFQWKQRFMRLVEQDSSPDLRKLTRLREALEGGAAHQIASGIMDGPGAYQAIWAELDLWYGGEHRFLEQQEREIMSFTPITSDQDVHRLQQFTLLLRNLLLNTSMAGIQTGRELYLCATQKIPRTLLVKYVETHDDTACDIHSFSAWMIRRLHTLRTVDERLSPRAPHTAPQTTTGALVAHTTRPPSRPTQRQASKSRKTHKSPTKPCVFCKSKHFHEDCSVYTDCHSRQQFLQDKYRCLLCFSS